MTAVFLPVLILDSPFRGKAVIRPSLCYDTTIHAAELQKDQNALDAWNSPGALSFQHGLVASPFSVDLALSAPHVTILFISSSRKEVSPCRSYANG
jgi:hypothetical protein